jgi:peptidoglycan/LPS O-acetylase OafA/YrhL
MSVRERPMLALFLVSLAAVGYEIALTRYFAVAKWSEYGYWVISIVMAGFALSGVVLALARDSFARQARWVMPALPALLVVAAALGFSATVANPFNPLQLQNAAT